MAQKKTTKPDAKQTGDNGAQTTQAGSGETRAGATPASGAAPARRKFRVTRPFSIGGKNCTAGEVREFNADEAKALGPKFVEPVE